MFLLYRQGFCARGNFFLVSGTSGVPFIWYVVSIIRLWNICIQNRYSLQIGEGVGRPSPRSCGAMEAREITNLEVGGSNPLTNTVMVVT